MVYCMFRKLKQNKDISIGQNLRDLRHKAQLAQEQVVAQLRDLSTPRSTYSQMDSGTYNIRISELIALSEILQTDYNTFFKGLIIRNTP